MVNKGKLFRFLLFGLFMIPIVRLSAQSTVGTDFWVTFMHNNIEHNDLELKLIITGPRNCSGTVRNPNTNWSKSFNVTAGTITNVSIPYSQAYTETSETITNTGLNVVSSDSISLYASNFGSYTFDVTNVLPTFSLGDDYMIQMYPDDPSYDNGSVSHHDTQRNRGHGCEFVIMAVEDQTVVDINLTARSANGINPYRTFSKTLNAGQCYQLKCYGGDLSGSRITARDSKKVAVFSGHVATFVPFGHEWADHLVEQMMPLSCWGKNFVVTGSLRRTKDRVRVTASNDNCAIMKNGNLLTTINARQTYEFEINSNTQSCYIETSEPSMVCLYLTGSSYGGSLGDPSMVIINPIEQQINEITFGTFTTNATEHHFVNIVVNAENASGMKLDGNNIASQFSPVTGNTDYKFARIEVSYGAHTLKNNNGGFIAHVYGLGTDESYAYSVGSMAINLTSQLFVNDLSVLSYPNGFDVCQNDLVDFALNLNYNPSRVEWTFDDGGTDLGDNVTHAFSVPGDYDVSCDVYRIVDGVESLEITLAVQMHVFEKHESDDFVDVCDDSYEWQGQVYTQSGTYDRSFPTPHGCDSIVHLHLTLDRSPEVPSIEGQENVFVATDLVTGIYHYKADPVLYATRFEWSLTGADWLMDTLGTSCTLTVIYPGTGILALRAWNDCGYTEMQKTITAGYFDVDEQEPILVNVYPNPAKYKAIVESESIMRIRIYSINGQLLQEIDGNGSARVEVNLSDYVTSPYLLEVMTPKGIANVKLNVVR